jgi:hypothetical protein
LTKAVLFQTGPILETQLPELSERFQDTSPSNIVVHVKNKKTNEQLFNLVGDFTQQVNRVSMVTLKDVDQTKFESLGDFLQRQTQFKSSSADS